MIRTRLQGDTPFFPNMLNNGKVEVCLKEDVDIALFEKDKEIAGLNAKLEDVNELIKTARQMLEDVKATHYAEMVDAGMRERRLKRALWLARAERAKYRVEYWSCRGGTLLEHYPFCVNGDSPFNRLSEMGCLYGDSNERLKEAKFKHLYASEWMLVWENVERKCRAKTEEYK